MDETLPFGAGTMGHLGSTASAHLMGNCDTLLIIGSNDPWTEFYPKPGAVRAVQVDIDGRKVGNRYPVEVGLVGDAAETLARLAELLNSAVGQSGGPPDGQRRAEPRKQWRADVEEQVRAWRALSEERSRVPAKPVNPELVVRKLSGRLPHNAQVSVDVGSCVYWYARQLILPEGVPAHLSGTLASMGCSVPCGIAAKLARPAGGGVGRRRCHADGRNRRAGHRGTPLAAVVRPALCGVCLQQPRAGRSYVGAARNRVRAEVPGQPGNPGLIQPFPAGAEKLDGMRSALAAEGGSGEGAAVLLDTYAGQEESRS